MRQTSNGVGGCAAAAQVRKVMIDERSDYNCFEESKKTTTMPTKALRKSFVAAAAIAAAAALA